MRLVRVAGHARRRRLPGVQLWCAICTFAAPTPQLAEAVVGGLSLCGDHLERGYGQSDPGFAQVVVAERRRLAGRS